MKKVFVLAAAVLLLAAPAMAAITGTKHDLSSLNTATYGAGGGSNTDAICVFCHTPHGAQAANNAPLWNRGTTTVVNYYGEGTTNGPTGTLQASISLNDINASDAPLCLSCHDGATVAAPVNEPNSLGTNSLTITATVGANAQIGDGGGNLSNDHPVGFSFTNTLVTDDGELNDKATIEGTAGMAGALSYGTTGDQMWCSSCHDVHGTTDGSGNPIPTFLRVDNAGSNLCLTCHIK